MPINFQYNIIQLSSSYVPKFYSMILKIKGEDTNIAPAQKWKVPILVLLHTSMGVQQYLRIIWDMSNKMVIGGR